MVLRTDIDLEQFFRCVRACEGDVKFRTAENDLLNLRSGPGLFVFAANCSADEALRGGEVLCEKRSDEKRLKEFMQ